MVAEDSPEKLKIFIDTIEVELPMIHAREKINWGELQEII